MMTKPTGRYTTNYDPLQRKRSVVTPVCKLATYSDDAISRRSQMNAANAGVFTYSYDRVERIVKPDHEGSPSSTRPSKANARRAGN